MRSFSLAKTAKDFLGERMLIMSINVLKGRVVSIGSSRFWRHVMVGDRVSCSGDILLYLSIAGTGQSHLWQSASQNNQMRKAA